MAFIVSTETLSQAWQDAQLLARLLKAAAQGQKDASLAGPVSGDSILRFEKRLRADKARLQQIAAVPGVAQYVANQPDTPPGYDVAAEFSAMVGQIDATVTWIRGAYPTTRVWTATELAEPTFTTAQLAGYRTQLDALLATL